MLNPPITGNTDLDSWMYQLTVEADNFGTKVQSNVDPVTGADLGYPYQYIQIKYADDTVGTNLSNSPTYRLYWGIHNSDTATESTNPADYTWFKAPSGFGTLTSLYYLVLGGRQIKFSLATAAPTYKWQVDSGGSVDLDIVVPTTTVSFNELMNAAVTELKIAANAVTATKINVAALDQALGDLRPNTVSAAQLVTDAVTQIKILDGAVSAAKTNIAAISASTGSLNSNTVGSTQLVANSVVAGKIAADAIVASNIQAGTITGDRIYANTITATNMAANSIAAAAIAADAVTAVKIQAGSVTTDKIDAGAVTAAKMTVGTLSAITANLGTVTAGTMRIGTGTTPSGNVFELNSAGTLYSTNFFGNQIYSENYSYSGIPAAQFVSFGAAEGIVGSVSSTNSSGSGHGVRGRNNYNGTSGLVGAANGYDFYADGSGTNYGPFTGTHDSLVVKGSTFTIGDIVIDSEIIERNGVSSTVSLVVLSSSPKQIAPLGVVCSNPKPLSDLQPSVYVEEYVDGANIMKASYSRDIPLYDVMPVNSVGEGQMNVCGEGGTIFAGDLICASSYPGKGMKQDDDLVHSYTVAKSRETVNFTGGEFKMISCIYLCG